MKEGLSGTTILFCAVDAKGLLVGCEIDREDHPGSGFGGAALAVVGKFQMNAVLPGGASVAGETVKLPIRFLPPAK